tara:strand:+ start:3447 stop:5072 length:1626 start_codon:yes stop_codon:yes gene_type:complete
MIPSSFCTICTSQCKQELVGFLLSLSIHHKNATVYIMCDSKTKSEIDKLSPKILLDIKWTISLDKYSNMNRAQMETINVWGTFLKSKADIMIKALTFEKDVLFIDSDTIILDKLEVDNSKDVGLSPQFIKQVNVDETGYYNAGLLWTNKKSVCEYWKEITIDNHECPEQIHMNKFCDKFQYFEFGENYNLQTWRFIVGKEDGQQIASYLNVDKSLGKLMYKDKPLKFIHTHFNSQRFQPINKFFIQKLSEANYYRELACIFRLIHNKWIIEIPKQPRQNINFHKNDSFRELAVLWRIKNKDVDINFVNSNHCWLNPTVLLYDRPTLEWVDNDVIKATTIYFGNGSMKDEGSKLNTYTNKKVQPWIFWPRRPMVLEKVLKDHGYPSFKERTCKSIFIGNFENSVQEKYRNITGWEKVLDEYHCTAGFKHKFNQTEYLMKLRNSRFGLCLRGYGSKCHREVELMAFGTVPIVTKYVSIKDYLDPPQEGLHYITASNPQELKKKVDNITESEWHTMSNACRDWYMKNIHSDNSWKTFIHNVLYK